MPDELTREQTEGLTDQELENKIMGEAASPATDPPAENAGELPAKPIEETPKSDTPPAPAPPASEEPPKEEPPALTDEEPQTYAGKYKTTDDLAKGLLDIAKPLNYNPKILERIIDVAKKTGDWGIVESTYLDLQESLGKKETALAPSEEKREATADKSSDTPPIEADIAEEQKLKVVIHEEVMRELGEGALAKELSNLGVQIPDTTDKWNQLKIDYPFQAMMFDQAYREANARIRKDVLSYAQALKGVDEHNQKLQSSAKDQITQFAKDYNLKLETKQVDEIISAGLKSDFVFEDQHGVKYLRENGLLEFFLAKHFPTLAKQIKLDGELNGRTQYATDLTEMQKKSLNSIGTSRVAPKQKEKTKIDLDDPSQIAALSDAELEERLSGKK